MKSPFWVTFGSLYCSVQTWLHFGDISTAITWLNWVGWKKEEKHIFNKMFTGLSRDFGGNLFMCFFSSPIRNDPPKKHINKILPPTQSEDNPANIFMFMCFYFSWVFAFSLSGGHPLLPLCVATPPTLHFQWKCEHSPRPGIPTPLPPTFNLETNLASHWEGVRLARASGKSSPEVPQRLPQKFSHCGTWQQWQESRGFPEVSQTSPEDTRTSPEVHQSRTMTRTSSD